jgi:hypothetical protein
MMQCRFTHVVIKNSLSFHVLNPVILVSNPHPVGLASLHRGGFLRKLKYIIKKVSFEIFESIGIEVENQKSEI